VDEMRLEASSGNLFGTSKTLLKNGLEERNAFSLFVFFIIPLLFPLFVSGWVYEHWGDK
jgi:hypothetical protein